MEGRGDTVQSTAVSLSFETASYHAYLGNFAKLYSSQLKPEPS